MCAGLTDDVRSGGSELADNKRILFGDVILEEQGAGRGADSCGFVKVFDRDGYPG